MAITGKPINKGINVGSVNTTDLIPIYNGSSEDTVATVRAIIEAVIASESYENAIGTLRALVSNNTAGVAKLQELIKDFNNHESVAAAISARVSAIESALPGKQDELKNGTNIKSVNGNSLMGSGNVSITPESINAYTKTEITSLLTQWYNDVLSAVSQNYVPSSSMSSYATSESVATIASKANQISLLVNNGVVNSETIIGTITDADGNLKSSIKLKADQIEIGDLKSGVKVGGLKIQGQTLKAIDDQTTTEEEEGIETTTGKTTTTTLSEKGFAQKTIDYNPVATRTQELSLNTSAMSISSGWSTRRYYNTYKTDITPDAIRVTRRYADQDDITEYVLFEVKSDESGSIARSAITWGMDDNGVFSVTLNENMFPLLKEYRTLINTMSAKITALETQLNNFITQYNTTHPSTEE